MYCKIIVSFFSFTFLNCLSGLLITLLYFAAVVLIKGAEEVRCVFWFFEQGLYLQKSWKPTPFLRPIYTFVTD